jgi:hypothetical protein
MSVSTPFDRGLFSFFHERDMLMGKRIAGSMRRRHVRRITRLLEDTPEGTISPVPVVEDIDAHEFYRTFVANKIPAVIKGGAQASEAVKKWSFEYFKSEHGEQDVPVALEEISRTTEYTSYKVGYEMYQMEQFVNEVQAGASLYLKFIPMFRMLPQLLDDLPHNLFSQLSNGALKRKKKSDNEFYMGGKGSCTHLHTERSDIFHICIEGRKRWRLYSPQNSMLLYPVPAPTMFIGSEVDFMQPDFDVHPWFRYANGYELVLEEGDLLYVPCYYWHGVQNLEASISINCLWHKPWRSFQSMPLSYANSSLFALTGLGTVEQFIHFYSSKKLPNLHRM